jgi:hypothetical protein
MRVERDVIYAMIGELAARFPHAVVAKAWQPHRPLAIGIYNRIIEAWPAVDQRVLALSVRAYTRRLMYQRALATPGVDASRAAG